MSPQSKSGPTCMGEILAQATPRFPELLLNLQFRTGVPELFHGRERVIGYHTKAWPTRRQSEPLNSLTATKIWPDCQTGPGICFGAGKPGIEKKAVGIV
jgi:hypothetical protein